MAQKFSTFGAQCTTNAAATATALGGGITTADVQALGAMMTALALKPDIMVRCVALTNGPGGQTLANQLIPG
jgi:hypothetical protein